MGKQHNRRIFAGFYKRYDGKFMKEKAGGRGIARIRVPIYRLSETHTDYAKDLCTNYKTDLRRYNLCVKQKRYIGVYGKPDFDMLKEELKFLHT